MPKVVEGIEDISNVFICFPASYLFFGRKTGKDFLKLIESQDIGLLSYNISAGNVVVVLSAKDPLGSFEYAGIIHLTPSTMGDFKRVLSSIPESYSLKAYLIGDKSSFDHVRSSLENKGASIEGAFPFRGKYQHVLLWWSPKNGLHMSVNATEEIPEEVLLLMSKAKNIDMLPLSIISIKENKLKPSFDLNLLNKEPKKQTL